LPILGLRCRRGYIGLEDCLVCPNRCIIPQPVLECLDKQAAGYYKHRSKEYHVTSLIGCPRLNILKYLLGDYPPPLNLWKMATGTLGHEFMEKYPTGDGVAEQQVEGEFLMMPDDPSSRCTVVGRFDWYDNGTKYINDWKFIWNTNYMPSENHFRQVATYAVLGRQMFGDKWGLGGQINYIDITCGRRHRFILDGSKYETLIEEMKEIIPVRVREFYEAEEQGLVPAGEPKYKQCNYCPPEFKQSCRTNCEPQDIRTIAIFVNEYRENNTPKEDGGLYD